MKYIIVAVCLLATPVLAQQSAPLPITLTGQEYDMLITNLIQRDPVLGTLVAKQREAQQAIQPKTEPKTDK